MARDTISDNLVEYCIQDLPLDRVNDAYYHMLVNYIVDEPVAQVLGSANDLAHFEDYKLCWKPIVAQRMPLVCFKAGSDQIVGVNMLYVCSKEDRFIEKCRKQVSWRISIETPWKVENRIRNRSFDINQNVLGFSIFQFESQLTKDLFDLLILLYENYDPNEKYNVNEYMASLGLSVDRKYRGRSIGDHFLSSRKAMFQEFGLKFTQTIFTSDFSNANADKVGFQTDVAIRYGSIARVLTCCFTLKNV